VSITPDQSTGTLINNGIASGGTVTGSFGTRPAVGSTVIVTVSLYNSSSPAGLTVTDNQSGNSYVADQTVLLTTSTQEVYTFRATNVASAGTFTLTLHTPANGVASYAVWGAQSFTNVAASPVDKQNSKTSASAQSLDSGTTGVLTQADEVAIFSWTCGSGTNDTITPPAGYTAICSDGNGAADIESWCGYKIVAATTALDPTCSTNGAAAAMGASIQTYKGTGSAAVEYLPWFQRTTIEEISHEEILYV
jgi:hypothetical protein